MSRSFHTKVVDVTHPNPDGTSRQQIIRRCRRGEALLLVREPDNLFDSNAVKVCRETGEQIGYLYREVAEEVAPLLDAGKRVEAVISSLTGGGWFSGKSPGVNLLITKH